MWHDLPRSDDPRAQGTDQRLAEASNTQIFNQTAECNVGLSARVARRTVPQFCRKTLQSIFKLFQNAFDRFIFENTRLPFG